MLHKLAAWNWLCDKYHWLH